MISGSDWTYKPIRMNGLGYHDNAGSEGAARQSVLPLRVAVCAWCKPRELGAGLGALSHGICPRHFREMSTKLQSGHPGSAGEPVATRVSRSRKRSRSTEDIAQLGFPFPVPVDAASPISA